MNKNTFHIYELNDICVVEKFHNKYLHDRKKNSRPKNKASSNKQVKKNYYKQTTTPVQFYLELEGEFFVCFIFGCGMFVYVLEVN